MIDNILELICEELTNINFEKKELIAEIVLDKEIWKRIIKPNITIKVNYNKSIWHIINTSSLLRYIYC